METLPLDEEIRALLSGQTKPDTELVAYLVKEARAAQDEAERASSAVQSARKVIQDNEVKFVAATSRVETHIKSLRDWLHREKAQDTSEPKTKGKTK